MARMEGMGFVLAVAWRASQGLSMEVRLAGRVSVTYAGFAGVFRSALMADSRSEGFVAGA